MEVGDYVRTRGGKIFKWNIVCKIKQECSEEYINEYTRFCYIDKNDIIKSSPNIIDLIEVGDYVNGRKVVDKQYHYTDKDNYDIGEWCIFYENVALGDYQYDIKSIVTKEQFKSMEYKVGE